MSQESLLCLFGFAEFWDVAGGRGCTGRGEGGWAHTVPCPGVGCAGSGCAPGSQLGMCSVLCEFVPQVCLDSMLTFVCSSTFQHQHSDAPFPGHYRVIPVQHLQILIVSIDL